MNLDHDFVQVSKLSEDQKKGLLQHWHTFFSPNSSGDLRSDAHQSQIIGGDADVDHTQTTTEDTVKLFPPPPPRFRHPCLTSRSYWKIIEFAIAEKLLKSFTQKT